MAKKKSELKPLGVLTAWRVNVLTEKMTAKRGNVMRRPSISQEVYLRLQEKICFGESKHQAKKEGRSTDGIYSFKTYQTYKENGQRFAKWAKSERGATDLEDAKQYIADYLTLKEQEGCSAYTIKTYAASISKVYGISINDIDYTFKERKRADIKRSRYEAVDDSRRKGERNVRLVAQHTGLRRHELEALRGSQIDFRDGKAYLVDVKGKGGKKRDLPILNNNQEVINIIQRAGNDKVFDKATIYRERDIHGYRREYAQTLYRQLAEPISEIKGQRVMEKGKEVSRVYYCRNDAKGLAFDRKAMAEVSKALGHNRTEVIAINYLI